jgi:hypothetical protein
VTTDMDATQTVTPARRILAQPVASGFTILNLETSQYYELDGTAGQVWKAISAIASPETVAADLARRFNVDPARVLLDVQALVDSLRSAGLVVVHGSREAGL